MTVLTPLAATTAPAALAAKLATLSGVPSTSLSLASTVLSSGLAPSTTLRASAAVFGASLAGVTLIAIVTAGEVTPLLSVTVNCRLTLPFALTPGV